MTALFWFIRLKRAPLSRGRSLDGKICRLGSAGSATTCGSGCGRGYPNAHLRVDGCVPRARRPRREPAGPAQLGQTRGVSCPRPDLSGWVSGSAIHQVGRAQPDVYYTAAFAPGWTGPAGCVLHPPSLPGLDGSGRMCARRGVRAPFHQPSSHMADFFNPRARKPDEPILTSLRFWSVIFVRHSRFHFFPGASSADRSPRSHH
jgi:hypothetical protein